MSPFFPSFIYPINYVLVYRFMFDLNSDSEKNAIVAVLRKRLCFNNDVSY